MQLSDTLLISIKALRDHLGRSLLTILGVIIGVMAIVLVVALGQNAQTLILSQIETIGGNSIIIRPGRQPEGPNDFTETLFSDSLKDADIEALKKTVNVPNLNSVAPAVIVPGSVTYREAVFRPMILGWTASALAEMFNLVPEEGFLFGEEDIKQKAKVAVIGSRVRQELFGESRALGEFISIKGQKLRVVAVMPPVGQISAFNVDELIILPYSTAQSNILGINHFHEVIAQADPSANVEQVASDIRATLREQHGLQDSEKDDFFVMTQSDIKARVSAVTSSLTIFLVAIAAISLLVSGIGIMNIMLVSVTERTQEIGLRKAVGATNKDIMQQFIFESVILTLSGGTAGTAGAIGISLLVVVIGRQFNLEWPFSMPWSAIALGLGTAALTGLVFGLYPARKAALKDPIESLRYE